MPSLASVRPDLVKEWCQENKLTSDEIAHDSMLVGLWKCSGCGYRWHEMVWTRAKAKRVAGICPDCMQGYDRNRPGYFYLLILKISNQYFLKFGITCDISVRRKALPESRLVMTPIFFSNGRKALALEQFIRKEFHTEKGVAKKSGFSFSGCTETLAVSLIPSVIERIKKWYQDEYSCIWIPENFDNDCYWMSEKAMFL